MAAPMLKCYGGKPPKRKPKPSIVEAPKPVESFVHERTDYEECYDRVREATPAGFHELLQKVARAAILARPAHLYRFIADFLDVQLGQRTFDEMMYSCKLIKSKKLEPTESCRLLDVLINQTKLEITGPEQFMYGPIPEYQLTIPALDRYRDYAGIDVFDMTCCEVPPEPLPIPTGEEAPEEPTVCAPPEPAPPAPAPRAEVDFGKGPVPDYEMREPALDRYRDHAGIGPFDLSGMDECEEHAAQCKCTFCMLKESRSRSASAEEPEERMKPCAAKRTDDLFRMFVDSPVYHEEKVADDHLHKADEESIYCEPFGEVFQQDVHFEENVFEPEYFGEKTFMQEHPLFGECGRVKLKPEGEADEFPESPEVECCEHESDPEEPGEEPEIVCCEHQNDPEEESEVGEEAEIECCEHENDPEEESEVGEEAEIDCCEQEDDPEEELEAGEEVPEQPPEAPPEQEPAPAAEEEKGEPTEEEQVAENFEGKPFEEQEAGGEEQAPETFEPETIESPEGEGGDAAPPETAEAEPATAETEEAPAEAPAEGTAEG